MKTLENFDPSAPIPDLWTQFGGIAAKPLMVIRGENSKLLSAETAAKMKLLHPGMGNGDGEGAGSCADAVDGGAAGEDRGVSAVTAALQIAAQNTKPGSCLPGFALDR